MPNEQLVNYIKKELKKGSTEGEIRANLQSKDWKVGDIEEAFLSIKSEKIVTESYVEQDNALPSLKSLPSGGQLMKKTRQMVKERFKTLFLIAFSANLLSIFTGLLNPDSSVDGSNLEIIALPEVNIAVALFLSVLGIIAGAWGQVALLYNIKSWKEKLSIKESFRVSVQDIGSLLWVYLLVGVAIFAGFLLLIIPGIIFSVWFLFAPFVLVMENKKGSKALEQSKNYVSGNWLNVAGKYFYFGLHVMLYVALMYIILIVLFLPLVFAEALLSTGVGIFLFLTGFLFIFGAFASLIEILYIVYMYNLYKSLKSIKVT